MIHEIEALEACGYRLSLNGENIKLEYVRSDGPDARRVAPLIEKLRRRKHTAVEYLRGKHRLPERLADWPEKWIEALEERAAIMEFDAHLARRESECRAEELVRHSYYRQQLCGQPENSGDIAGESMKGRVDRVLT